MRKINRIGNWAFQSVSRFYNDLQWLVLYRTGINMAARELGQRPSWARDHGLVVRSRVEKSRMRKSVMENGWDVTNLLSVLENRPIRV